MDLFFIENIDLFDERLIFLIVFAKRFGVLHSWDFLFCLVVKIGFILDNQARVFECIF